MGHKSRTNSFDIAFLAGVSQPTVSRALRNSPLVSHSTRHRVQQIARELNYKVDKNASNLRSLTAGTLALLFFEDPSVDDTQINPFFFSMLGSITRACGQRGYDLLVSFQQSSTDWFADYEDSKKADGLILLGYGDAVTYRERLETLMKRNTHFVRWGAVDAGQPWVTVGSDNIQGAREMTQHLLAQGCRRIAFFGNATEHCPEFCERYQGYQAALRAAGIAPDPALHVDVVASLESAGHDAMRELIARQVPFDAVFAASDLIAIGALRELQLRGISVPDQIAIAGFDDLPISAMSNPSLSTVAQNTLLAGRVLVDSLLGLIRGEAVPSRSIPTALAVRESTHRRQHN
jgi:DNA-binding LacI/PurR family transcriptional regulator